MPIVVDAVACTVEGDAANERIDAVSVGSTINMLRRQQFLQTSGLSLSWRKHRLLAEEW